MAKYVRKLVLCKDVLTERRRQEEKWGEQNHPNGTSEHLRNHSNGIKDQVDIAAGRGELTWRMILDEEVSEAFAEEDKGKLRTELVEVAAVALAWIECLDRNT